MRVRCIRRLCSRRWSRISPDAMQLVTEDERLVRAAALARETMYVANTGRFHDDDAVRNDYSMDRWFAHQEIGPAGGYRS